jgi:hypothetical protein
LHSPALHGALDAVAGLEVKGTVDTAKEHNQWALGDERLSDYEQRYTAIRQAGVEEAGKGAPPASGGRGPKTQSKSQNRLDRLGEYREETLAFERRCGALGRSSGRVRLADDESQAEGIGMFSLPPLPPAE